MLQRHLNLRQNALIELQAKYLPGQIKHYTCKCSKLSNNGIKEEFKKNVLTEENKA